MQGIVLAGGQGTRLGSLTAALNKHLLPVWDRPLIARCVDQLASAGVRDIIVVTNTADVPAMEKLFDRAGTFGAERVRVVSQDRPGGVAHALLAARDAVTNARRILVMLGDGVFVGSIEAFVHHAAAQADGARLMLVRTETPERYGIAELASDRVRSVTEKPGPGAESSWVVTGLYSYPANVFDVCEMLEPSERGELEISDVNNWYASRDQAEHEVWEGDWIDAGTPEDLFRATELVRAAASREQTR